jgi:serine/threonine protein kinase
MAGRKKLPTMGATLNVGSKYVITKKIGAGSFGVVCEAVDTTTQERVAIKQITRLFEEI